ncbi:hypothetical protein FB451DRAFT_599952 [Mycena latifolia]|nr:hypothetical protein FB451DRAFT_599952 [Mycena latifolia]
MRPFLEHVPYDILQHIALLGAEPGRAPPADLCSLLATSRVLYDGLNVHSNPHLYAAIFKLKYVRNASHRPLPDSSLALELLQRCRALRRCHILDMSTQGLRQDLWTLLGMVVEEGLCEPLSESGFSTFLVELAQYYLGPEACPRDEVQTLVIWLLCFGFARHDIVSQNPGVRNTLLTLLRRFVSAARELPFTSPPPSSAPTFPHAAPGPIRVGPRVDEEITRFNAPIRARLPPSVEGAIILTFALKEAVPLQIPYHLPATRAVAVAENRSGPTAEDYTAFQRAGTVLYQATHASATSLSSMPFDPWISDALNVRGSPGKRVRYPPGTLAGVWEGSLMISCCVSLEGTDTTPTASPDFLCRTPIHCELSEYFCSESGVPQERENFENLGPSALSEEDFHHELNDGSLEHVLIGQTLREHEEAWGPDGFDFVGKVHDDGLIVFTRQPKNDESAIPERWLFEGHLRYGTALVGTFRSSSSDELCGIQGIFSMRKRAEAPVQLEK